MFRTYADEIPDLYGKHIVDSFANKPRGGLWGCRSTEWKDWCTSEEFPCSDKYFNWGLKKGTNVYVIDNANDFVYLLRYYPRILSDECTVDSIDYMRMWKEGYEAVELTEQGYQDLRMGLTTLDAKNVITKYITSQSIYNASIYLGMNAWDVPSICVFEPSKSVIITSGLKYAYPYYKDERDLEVMSSGGNRVVNN